MACSVTSAGLNLGGGLARGGTDLNFIIRYMNIYEVSSKAKMRTRYK